MHHHSRNLGSGVTRRAAMGSVGAFAAVMGISSALRPVAAQEDSTGDLSAHPLVGTWLAMANPPLPDDPQIAVPSLFGGDGTVLLMFPLAQRGPEGPVFNSACVGTWEPDGERRGHFTAVQSLSDANGTFLGTVTVDGYPKVSEDGHSFVDDGSLVMVTIRDPAGVVVQQVPGLGGRPVTAIRMGPDAPGFPMEELVASPTP